MILPSKELFELIIDRKTVYFNFSSRPNTYIEYKTNINTNNAINMYEFIFKLKEWITTEQSYMFIKTINYGDYRGYQAYVNNFQNEFETECDTEFDAVVKAGEWILKMKELNDK